MPTAIWKSRLRSGSAHCNLEVAVEVRQCPLRSGARGGGPAVPTGIWSSRWRAVPTGIWTARRRTRRRWTRRRRRRRTALIKSNNPHLAGGEQMPEEMARNIYIYIYNILLYNNINTNYNIFYYITIFCCVILYCIIF